MQLHSGTQRDDNGFNYWPQSINYSSRLGHTSDTYLTVYVAFMIAKLYSSDLIMLKSTKSKLKRQMSQKIEEKTADKEEIGEKNEKGKKEKKGDNQDGDAKDEENETDNESNDDEEEEEEEEYDIYSACEENQRLIDTVKQYLLNLESKRFSSYYKRYILAFGTLLL